MSLTSTQNPSILIGITDTSVIGIDLLKFRKSAPALIRSAFFAPALWRVVWEHLRVRRLSFDGKVNPVQPATLLIDLDSGSSQLLKEDTAMSSNTVRTSAQTIQHVSKLNNDIEALATIGEEAIANGLPVDVTQYDVLFSAIKRITGEMDTDLSRVVLCASL